MFLNINHGLLKYPDFQLDSTVNYRRLKTQPMIIQYYVFIKGQCKYSQMTKKFGMGDNFRMENSIMALIFDIDKIFINYL